MLNDVRTKEGTVCTPAETVEWMDVKKKTNRSKCFKNVC